MYPKIKSLLIWVFCVVMGVLKGNHSCGDVGYWKEDSFAAKSFISAAIESNSRIRLSISHICTLEVTYEIRVKNKKNSATVCLIQSSAGVKSSVNKSPCAYHIIHSKCYTNFPHTVSTSNEQMSVSNFV